MDTCIYLGYLLWLLDLQTGAAAMSRSLKGTLQNAGFELRLNAEASPGSNLFTKLFVLCYSVFSAFLQKQVQQKQKKKEKKRKIQKKKILPLNFKTLFSNSYSFTSRGKYQCFIKEKKKNNFSHCCATFYFIFSPFFIFYIFCLFFFRWWTKIKKEKKIFFWSLSCTSWISFSGKCDISRGVEHHKTISLYF